MNEKPINWPEEGKQLKTPFYWVQILMCKRETVFTENFSGKKVLFGRQKTQNVQLRCFFLPSLLLSFPFSLSTSIPWKDKNKTQKAKKDIWQSTRSRQVSSLHCRKKKNHSTTLFIERKHFFRKMSLYGRLCWWQWDFNIGANSVR